MNRPSNKITSNLLALLLGCVFAAVLGEIALEIYFGKNKLFCMHEPNISLSIRLPHGIIRGLQERFRYSTNRQGMRGNDYPEDSSSYRILAVGGSTTICTYLDDAKTWPALVQKGLPRALDGRAVWVGTVGASGLTTRSHILQMHYLAPQYRVEAMFLLAGINDLVLRLWEHEKYDPDFMKDEINRSSQMPRIFSAIPDSMVHPFYKRSGFWKLARRTRSAYTNLSSKKKFTSDLIEWRRYRSDGQKIRTIPDLSAAVEEYERNLEQIIELSKQRNIRLIMLTQPVIWRAGMPEENENLLFGFIGDPVFAARHAHYSAEVLEACMKLYNAKLLQLCRQLHIECIDLASMLPQNSQVFYDDCHFTELGAELVADIVVEYLRTRPPFQTTAIQEK